jgi:hypothetical protein
MADIKGKGKERASGPFPATVESCDESSRAQTPLSITAAPPRARNGLDDARAEPLRQILERTISESG